MGKEVNKNNKKFPVNKFGLPKMLISVTCTYPTLASELFFKKTSKMLQQQAKHKHLYLTCMLHTPQCYVTSAQRSRLASYPAFYKLPNNNKKRHCHLSERSKQGRQPLPLVNSEKTNKASISVFYLFQGLYSQSFSPAQKGCFFKNRRATKDHSIEKPHTFSNCPPAVPKSALLLEERSFWSPGLQVGDAPQGTHCMKLLQLTY